MATKKVERESGSKIRIAGETYTLLQAGSSGMAVPKGKDCSKQTQAQAQAQTLPKGSDCSRVVSALRPTTR